MPARDVPLRCGHTARRVLTGGSSVVLRVLREAAEAEVCPECSANGKRAWDFPAPRR